MKNSGIEWIGEIPDSWECCRIKYLFSFVKGKLPSTTNQEGKGLPYIGASEMNGKPTKLYTEDEGLPICKQEDFLILWDGANAGLVATGLTGVVSSTVVKCSLMSNRYSQKYIYYLLKYAETYFRDKVNGTTIPHMNMEYINDIPYFNIGLDVQQKIAQYLDEKCGKIDELIANQEKQIEKLKEYKQSVITEAVTKGLDKSAPLKDSGIEWMGKIPADCELFRGKVLFRQRNEKGNDVCLQLLSPTQRYGVIPQEMYDELSGMTAVKLNINTDLSTMKTIRKGDYCISLRSFQGGFEYSKYEGVVSPAYQVFYAIRELDEGYYKYLFKEKGFISEMNSYTLTIRDGKNIAFADFANSYIPYPPLSIQKEISQRLDELSEQIDRLIAIKQEKIEKLQEYKKSLIYEYVTGKKEVV